MNIDFILFALKEGLKALLIITTPVMLIPMVVGILISVFQAVTQIQDQLLNFFPKFIIIVLIILIGTPFALSTLGNYFNELMMALPNYL